MIGVGLLTKSGVLEILGGVLVVAAVVLILLPFLTSWRPGLSRRKAREAKLSAQGEIAGMVARQIDNVLLRTLQGRREQGRALLNEPTNGIFIRPVADKAERWYQGVQELLNAGQRRRFIEAGPFWTGTPVAMVSSLKDHLRVLDEIINEMCVVPEPVLSPNAEWYRRALGR